MLLGILCRVVFLPDPTHFKLFTALVLLFIAGRLAWDLTGRRGGPGSIRAEDRFSREESGRIEIEQVSFRAVRFRFAGEGFTFSFRGVLLLSSVVGIVAGTYGIGGVSIVAPIFVTFFGLPVYTVAGAALLGTFITSIAGVLFYTVIAPFYADTGLAITPDWLLGLLFGLGGAAGIYLGARMQKFIKENFIKLLLVIIILFVAGKYIIGFFS